MRTYILILMFLVQSLVAFSQRRDFLVGMNFDLIKSDNDGYFEKAQVGLDINYFLSNKFTITTGVEIWTREEPSAVIGTRWYATRDAYIRIRGLVGENDLSIGAGWAKPMTEALRFEAMTDFYFTGNFTIRTGIVFRIKSRNPE